MSWTQVRQWDWAYCLGSHTAPVAWIEQAEHVRPGLYRWSTSGGGWHGANGLEEAKALAEATLRLEGVIE